MIHAGLTVEHVLYLLSSAICYIPASPPPSPPLHHQHKKGRKWPMWSSRSPQDKPPVEVGFTFERKESVIAYELGLPVSHDFTEPQFSNISRIFKHFKTTIWFGWSKSSHIYNSKNHVQAKTAMFSLGTTQERVRLTWRQWENTRKIAHIYVSSSANSPWS